MLTKQELRLRVRRDLLSILMGLWTKKPEEILDTHSLGPDLGIGTTGGGGEFIVLQNQIETMFGVKIPKERIPRTDQIPKVVVKQVVDLLCELLAEKAERTEAVAA